MKINILILVLASVQIAFAQTKGSIRGTVITSDNQAALFINISLKGTTKGTVTDNKGFFEIRNVEPGNYTLMTSAIGLEAKEIEVNVKAGETTLVPDIQLTESAQQLNSVEISALRDQFKADNPSSSLRIKSPLLETPQNIQVVTKDVLNDQQAFDMLESVQRNISGAQKLEHWDNYARINMRGSQITSFRNGLNVQISPWSPLTEDMSMVERIEFVKGPAGFMISSGEPSGIYNVVTKKPTGNEKGEVTFSLGSFDTYRATGDLDGKLSKNGKLLYRLNLMGQLKGSHRDYEFNNRYSIAPVIKYLVDERTSVTLEYTHQHSQMNVIGSNYAFSKRKYADLPMNFTTAEPNLDPTELNDKSLLAILEHEFNHDWKFTGQVSYLNHKQIGQSLWPSGFTSNDSLLQRGVSIWDAFGVNKSAQMFVNGDFKTGSVSHRILSGLDMSFRDYFADWNQGALLGDTTFNIYDPVYLTVPASEIPRWDRSQDIRERGVRYNNSYSAFYMQDEVGFLNNKLRLTIAGRYTTNNYINPYSGTSKDGKFTPRVGLSYSLNRTTSVYALYDQAFLANPGTDWQGKNFAPLTGNNIEAGFKRDWMNNKWNSVVSAYRIIKNNVLTADLDHPDTLTGRYFSKTAGQQQVQGVEVDIKGELAKNLSVIINYAYTDATTTKDSDPEVVGNKVAGATTHIQNLWLSYRMTNGTLAGLKFSLGYQYQAGRSSWYIFDNTESALPDYFRLDGGVGYTKDNFSINLNVNNILNEYLYSGAPYGDMYYWQTEAGRNARVTVGYKF